MQKLIGFGDHRSSDIVAKIAEEEVAHVAVGVYWFAQVCQKMGRIPCHTFKGRIISNLHKYNFWGNNGTSNLHTLCTYLDLLDEYGVELKGPFNYSARDEAGIPRDW